MALTWKVVSWGTATTCEPENRFGAGSSYAVRNQDLLLDRTETITLRSSLLEAPIRAVPVERSSFIHYAAETEFECKEPDCGMRAVRGEVLALEADPPVCLESGTRETASSMRRRLSKIDLR